MQVLKKFSLFLLCLGIIGCSTTKGPEISDRGGSDAFNTDISEINIGGTAPGSNFRVGVLLPLTGEAARHGQGLKNATMLALEDVKNPNLILQYYDTKSTPGGARIAANNAIAQRSNLIIGPLMSTEVQAIANETIYQGVPVIAFSTSQEVLQPTVYTMGLLVEEQVNRIMTYAAEHGRRRFALLIPDNSTGSAVAKAAVKAAQKNGVEVTVIGFYPPNTSDFSGIIKQMSNYSGNPEKPNPVNFDAVLIPESGAKLTSAISMFAYYDVSYPQVQFLGTSIWEVSKLNNESTIVKSWYPVLSRTHSTYFANKYASIFKERPTSLYAFAYDAVALSNELSKQGIDNINQAITSSEGYAGINGAFRFFEDGTNQHSLDIMEVRPNGDVVIEQAPRRFGDDGQSQRLQPVVIDSSYRAPRIYGKDASTAQIMIYGQVLPSADQYYRGTGFGQQGYNEELQQMNNSFAQETGN